MSVRRQEARLLQAAEAYCRDAKEKARLLSAALGYARSKFRAANARDAWKTRKRMRGGANNETKGT